MGRGLSAKKIRALTGAQNLKSILDKDVLRDRRNGNISIVKSKGMGITIRPTKKGRKVFARRVKKMGL